MSNGDSNNRATFWLGITSLILSALAFTVSVRSCAIAKDSHDLNARLIVSERQLILTRNNEEDAFSITLEPIDPSMKFLQGRAYLPRSVYKDVIPIDNDASFLHMGSVQFEFEKFVETNVPKQKGHIILAEMNFPLVIESYYAVKGQSFGDRSLYTLRTLNQVHEQEHRSPTVSIEGLIFVRRLSMDDADPADLVDALLESPGGSYYEAIGPERLVE